MTKKRASERWGLNCGDPPCLSVMLPVQIQLLHSGSALSQAMRERLLESGKTSKAAQAALDAGWPAVRAIGQPQELYAAMVQQHAACEGVLRGKDEVIAAMREALAAKDSDYVRTLTEQAEVRYCLGTA